MVFNGNQNISNINIIYNNNIGVSGIYYYYPNSMFSYYCIFYNNTVKDYWCILLNSNSDTISKSNIILNNSPTNFGVVTLWGGNYILKECIFDQNNNTLIFINSGTLELNN